MSLLGAVGTSENSTKGVGALELQLERGVWISCRNRPLMMSVLQCEVLAVMQFSGCSSSSLSYKEEKKSH